MMTPQKAHSGMTTEDMALSRLLLPVAGNTEDKNGVGGNDQIMIRMPGREAGVSLPVTVYSHAAYIIAQEINTGKLNGKSTGSPATRICKQDTG